MSSTHPTVLIVSSDARFAAAVIERWQRAVVCPSNSGACSADFVSMAADVSSGDAISAYNVAIIGPLTAERLPPLLERFGRTERPVLVIGDDACQAEVERATLANVIGIAQQGDWVGKVVLSLIHLLGGTRDEISATAEGVAADDSTIGRYVSEIRHKLNNALTAILGNAELLLIDAPALTERAREQVATIHQMALSMHELFRRMQSLEAETQFSRRAAVLVGSPARGTA